jgi:hypothetical protein
MPLTDCTITVLSADRVRISEMSETYCMSRTDVEESIQNIKDRRSRYASDVAYLKRLNFYESILTALQAYATQGRG